MSRKLKSLVTHLADRFLLLTAERTPFNIIRKEADSSLVPLTQCKFCLLNYLQLRTSNKCVMTVREHILSINLLWHYMYDHYHKK